MTDLAPEGFWKVPAWVERWLYELKKQPPEPRRSCGCPAWPPICEHSNPYPHP